MKALLFLVLLVVLILAALAVARALAARRDERARNEEWSLDEESDGEMVSVMAVHPVKERLLIGAVPFAAQDFDFRIEELRSEGMHKVTALNAGRSRKLGR